MKAFLNPTPQGDSGSRRTIIQRTKSLEETAGAHAGETTRRPDERSGTGESHGLRCCTQFGNDAPGVPNEETLARSRRTLSRGSYCIGDRLDLSIIADNDEQAVPSLLWTIGLDQRPTLSAHSPPFHACVCLTVRSELPKVKPISPKGAQAQISNGWSGYPIFRSFLLIATLTIEPVLFATPCAFSEPFIYRGRLCVPSTTRPVLTRQAVIRARLCDFWDSRCSVGAHPPTTTGPGAVHVQSGLGFMIGVVDLASLPASSVGLNATIKDASDDKGRRLASLSPFPCYDHALPSRPTLGGKLYLLGGFVREAARNDLYMIQTRENAATDGCRTLPPPPLSPRVGDACALVSRVLIVRSSDTRMDGSQIQPRGEQDRLDDALYLLNITTSGPGHAGRYGHAVTMVSSRFFVFGGQVDGEFFSGLWLFDLNSLRRRAAWELYEPSTTEKLARRMGQARIAFEDRITIFGGTDGSYGSYHHNDLVVRSQNSQVQCIGFVATARPCSGSR
ncbi:hypothetical protein FA13DRAFT_1717162 [Coprinellus micaceus]|uniref:Galactose oxidase n=1 Tax=Coprinellus micaceus TaxID=71717 RepID=A0A4Y7SHI0_COPMI|nr:hypothetical protein FA13DRAFT_1717162 [Coprinellus micaceus]